MSKLSSEIASLTLEQRAMLELRLRQRSAHVQPAHGIPRRRNAESYPLSFAQKGLWFLGQLEPDSPLYSCPCAMRMQGPLDVSALEQTLNEIVRRHEVLRTTFPSVEGKPVQVIAPALHLSLLVTDLTTASEAEREALARRLITREVRTPFDLARGPLVRARLLRLGVEDHIVLLTMHHIVSDRWSSDVLVRETTALYNAFCEDKPSPLAELSVQYADYAAWEEQQLENGTLAKGLDYWTRQLAAAPPSLDLPTDRPRPKAQGFKGARHSFVVSRPLTDALKNLSQREGATLFMTLLAAFKTLLYRYTSQDDLLVGTPVANRNQVEAERLIGFFVNTLVLRTDCSGEPSFRELLGRVRETSLGAYAHQGVPFEKLVEELQPERDRSRNPLFQVMFVLQNAPQTVLTLSKLTLRNLEVDSGTAMLDLSLSMEYGEEGLRGAFEYNTDLFDGDTVERMAGHFRQLLSGIAARPEQRIADLPLLTSGERQQLLSDWNNTELDYPRHLCIHELIAAQAARTPDAVAVVSEEQRLSYGELNSRANQLAHYLRSRGVRAETPVAVMLERSTSLVVALLGVLKAGGAYVPLDPAYPQERLRWMLEDTAAPLIIMQRELAGRVDVGSAEVVFIDEWAEIAVESAAEPQWKVSSEQLAYVIYTSGSTGKPKGVQVSQSSVVNLLWSMRHQPGLNEHDIFCAVTTLSFDIAALELFLPLIVGARLVVVKQQMALDGRLLAEILAETGATAMQATPTTWRLLLDAGWQGSPRFKILCGGEALPPELAKRLLNGCACLWNLYGPTETTIWSTVFQIEDGRVLIGKPIANTKVFVLDSKQQPVAAGVAGELYIGGAGVARGYFNRPELTAERFVVDSLSGGAGQRLYRTGDLARFLPDGHLEVLRRIDHQVKLRGFRIELGEVEAALSQHASVREAVVVVREDAPGNKQLVGYLVAGEAGAPSLNELRSFLKDKLPEYMIPSIFVTLGALPLTPNGKVNRQALPAPSGGRLGSEQEFVPARNAVEEVLCDIWTEILNVERVGIHDNFFELGGHSLLATQVLSRVRKSFQVDEPLRSFFETPTVAALAASIEAHGKAARGGALSPPLRRRISPGRELPLSFAQQRLWFLDQLEPGNPFYNIHAAVRLRGPLNTGALEQSLQEIIVRHESLRTSFTAVEGQPSQIIAAPARFNLAVSDLSDEREAERESSCRRLAREEARRPFNLARGPLFRVRLLRLGAEDHVLLVTMHHIISDGWSMGVVVREMSKLYEAFSRGEASPLTDLAVQYADFARWQREWLQGETLKSLLDYWKQHLSGAAAVLRLPTDRPRPAVQSFKGVRRKFSWPASLLEELRMMCRREGVTLFMLLLAAFDALLYHCTKETEIIVGSDVANRNLLETEGLIGFFVNQVALRTSLAGDPSFRELLERVRQTALGAYAHQDVPFEKVVEAVNPKRSLQQSPLIQVKFVLGNIPVPQLEFAGLTLTTLEHENETSQLDMILHVVESEQGLGGFVEYNTELFDGATIDGWMKSLELILRHILSAPEARLNELAGLMARRHSAPYLMTRTEGLGAASLPSLPEIKRRPIRRPVQTGSRPIPDQA